eukprot:3650575-Rhodomonas_salina.1
MSQSPLPPERGGEDPPPFQSQAAFTDTVETTVHTLMHITGNLTSATYANHALAEIHDLFN